MRSWSIAARALIGFCALRGAADAQPAKPPAPPAEKPTEKPAEPAPAEPKPKTSDADLPPPLPPDEKPPPPLPPPRADEQEPRPFLQRPAAYTPLRNVDIGPDFALWLRPADSDSIDYETAFAIGGHARIELARFIGVRAYVMHGSHPVAVPRGELGLADTDIDQPDIDHTLLALRVEPTWVVNPRLRLWAGLGIGWAFFSTAPPTTSGALSVRSAGRSGVALEPSAAIGGTVDVVPDWVTVGLTLSAGFVTNQSGSIFDPMQGFDQSGRMLHVGGLPEFAGSHAAIVSAGLVL